MRTLLRRVTESRANYRVGFVVELLCPLTFAAIGWQQRPAWPLAVAAVMAGALIFSFVEYAIHRWLFHSPASFMRPLHLTHHRDPEAPTALPCIASAVVSLAIGPPVLLALGTGPAGFGLAGFFGWYFVYSTLHHLEHHTRINRLPLRWLQRRWAEHAVHHRLEGSNFGVTTSLWDRAFGTYYRSARQPAARAEAA